jgi:ABC-type sulfate transport system permease component
VVSVVIFDLKEEGQIGAISVMGIFLLAVSFVIVIGVRWMMDRDIVATRE